MSQLVPFARPPISSPNSNASTTGDKPSSCLKQNESERLKVLVARVITLASHNPFAAILVIDMTETILRFFDA